MEFFIILFTILLFVFLNSLTYILGALATPAGSIFLGTVHWTGDYFYYLSQFAQGVSSWFYSYDLYTADFKTSVLVGWVNVFLGRLFYLIGINHLLAYQLSIVIFAATFLGVSYLLIREIFPGGNRGKRIIAFVLFVTSNAFPKIVFEGGRWSLSFFDFWFNTGLPFNRLGGVPHHLIARTAISLSLLLAIWWWKNIYHSKGDRPSINISWLLILSVGLLILGFILASVEPVHWILVLIVFLVTPTIMQFSIREPSGRFQFSLNFQSLKISNFKFQISNYLPFLFYFIVGLPMALYLKNLFSILPYSQLAIWENTQQLHINFLDFILGNGPVAVLAIGGLILFIKMLLRSRWNREKQSIKIATSRRTSGLAMTGKLVSVIFTILTISLYFSPIPEFLKVVNVRFLPATATLFLACMATETIFSMAKRFARGKTLVIGLLVGLILFITTPSTILQLQARTKTDPKNAFFYVSKDVIRAYQKAQKLSSIDDTFLVIWPFNWSYPAITGRRVYEGHNLLTVDYYRKEKLASDFFFGDMDKEKMQELLQTEKIDYVLTYPWTRNVNDMPLLEKIYDNHTLAIYRVNKMKN